MLVFQSMVQLQELAAKKVSGCLSSSQSAFDVWYLYKICLIFVWHFCLVLALAANKVWWCLNSIQCAFFNHIFLTKSVWAQIQVQIQPKEKQEKESVLMRQLFTVTPETKSVNIWVQLFNHYCHSDNIEHMK